MLHLILQTVVFVGVLLHRLKIRNEQKKTRLKEVVIKF